jgi:hypothetical protein
MGGEEEGEREWKGKEGERDGRGVSASALYIPHIPIWPGSRTGLVPAWLVARALHLLAVHELTYTRCDITGVAVVVAVSCDSSLVD